MDKISSGEPVCPLILPVQKTGTTSLRDLAYLGGWEQPANGSDRL